jgi:uncharacterized protein
MKAHRSLQIACAATLFAAAAACSAQQPQISISTANRTISVTANGSAKRAAEIATLTVGFTVYAADEASAYSNASTRSNAIMAALLHAGVAKDAITSQSQQITPVQSFENQQITPAERANRQFRADQSWNVRLNAANVATVLNAAVQAGANNSGAVDWDVSDKQALEAAAAANAISHAQAIAASMAKGLNIQLGSLLYATNTVESRPLFPRAMMSKAAPEGGAPQPLAITPGQVEQSATVTAVFAIQ